jgi:glutamyl-tRNA(Gln) amidotransferase subunit E
MIKCGFEWHFQLNTGKLFCRDKSEIYNEDSNFIITRKFRPSISELNEIDESAKFEATKSKQIIYKIYDNDCLVDIDEEPPREIDKEALQIALNVASALNCKIFDKLIVMRKIIIDGSAPSGFQRTVLIGVDGEFEVNGKKIPISTVCLEEDAARKEKEDENSIVYRLDRLGIPLIEVSTGIIETTPEEAKEIASAFGTFTRLFNVRRGIGTIRQDVNLSTERSKRVEIKGFQDLRKMDKIIQEEINRHENLLKLQEVYKDKVHEIKAGEVLDLSHIFQNTQSNLVKNAIAQGKAISGFRLENAKGLLGFKLQTSARFGREISDYLRVKYGVGIMHSDELPNYGISQEEVNEIKKTLSCRENDAFVLFISKKDANLINLIRSEIENRIHTLLTTFVEEVRVADEETLSTRFLRPIGGKERMYLETDLPIIEVSKEILEEASHYRGLTLDSLAKKLNTTIEKLKLLIDEGKLSLAEYYLAKGIDTDTFIKVFIDVYNFVENKTNKKPTQAMLEKLTNLIKDGKITEEAGRIAILEAVKNNKELEDVINEKKLWKLSEEQLIPIIKDLKDLPIERILATIKGKYGPVADPEEIIKILKDKIKE